MLEVSRFLGMHAPFSGLGVGPLEQLARAVEVEFFAPGTVVVEQGGAPSSHVYVIRRGAVELLDGGRVVDILGEGDLFGFPSMLSGQPPMHSARTKDETLCYLMPSDLAGQVFARPSGMKFLTLALRQRGSRTEGGQLLEGVATLADIPVGPVVTVAADTPVVDVARALTDAAATAAVIVHPAGVGIVTDRDIRVRLVASGLDPNVPVRQIATMRARTARPDDVVDVAIVRMLELGVHHLPLVERGRVVGMVTDLDLMGYSRRQSFRLRSEIERAPDVEQVSAAARRIPETLIPLIRVGVDPEHLGVVTATLVDGVTVRLIELAQAELGPAPVPFAWIALGSHGRRDQGMASDQDHALVYAGDSSEPDEWFARMASFVVDGLERAGFPRCISKMMASEDGWRGCEAWWSDRFEQWMVMAERKAAFLTAAAFDGRVVAGDLDVRTLYERAVNRAAHSGPFLRRLEHLIAEVKVPVGFLGNLVMSDEGEAGALDIKNGGVHAINEMARLFSRAGIRSVGTVRRLRQAAAEGSLEAEFAEALEEAFELFRELRTRHQAEQWTGGREIDNMIHPDDLGPLERRALRDAFRVVRDVQRSVTADIHPRLLGR